jgi:hypothetical protein
MRIGTQQNLYNYIHDEGERESRERRESREAREREREREREKIIFNSPSATH